MARQGQVLAAQQSARPVLLGAGGLCHRLGERRRLDARSPQDGAHLVPGGVAVVVLDLQAAQVQMGDDGAQVQLDTQFGQVARLGRGCPETWCSCSAAAGARSSMAWWVRSVLYQCTHSKVAASTWPMWSLPGRCHSRQRIRPRERLRPG
jgi:hypothetical protein